MPNRIPNRTYGTVPDHAQREMSGLEFVRGLVDGTLPLNTIAQTLDYDITAAENGRVVITAEPNETTSIRPARCMAGSARRCSTAVWDWPFCRHWKKASAKQPSNSIFHLCGPSPPKRARLRPMALC